MSLKIQTCVKMHIISLHAYGESGEKVQYYAIAAKNIVICTIMVDTKTHPDYCMLYWIVAELLICSMDKH